jgi:cyanophycin synthetase
MEILDVKVLRGPNYWSSYRQQLISMKVDLQEAERYPTDSIDGFPQRLEQLLPSLFNHCCSEKRPGGFFERVRSGTWLGHVAEHIALELQSLAGMPCGFGRTRSTKKKGIYHVVFAYQIEQAGKYAGEAAIRIVEALRLGKDYDLAPDINRLREIKREFGLGPTTQSIIDEAKKRNIPARRLDEDSLIMLGQGVHQKIVHTAMASTTSSIGFEIANDKEKTKRILREAHIPVPDGRIVRTVDNLGSVLEELSFPVVVKPHKGNHGRGIITNIRSLKDARHAFAAAKKISDSVIVEKFIKGSDYRLLVINYKFVAAAKRIPAMVTGDGRSSILALIKKINNDPYRGNGHENLLSAIAPDENTQSILEQKQLSLDCILPNGQSLFLKDTANLSSGGTARDVTDNVHPDNIFLAERIARLLDLNICGIDIITTNIALPLTEDTGAVIEVNAGPGLRMHLSPTEGNGRNVAEPIIDMLYPGNSRSRIPIVAVTGTNGKTTTTRLIAHFAKNAGHNVGYTTTDGIYIKDHLIHSGDCSGPRSAEAVLRDPIVDFAVFECARGGILRSGLGFDKCDIGIVTNVTEDHLGLDDIETMEDLAKVKAVVPSSVSKSGYAILNADDKLVFGMQQILDCNIALFSMDQYNGYIRSHCGKGGIAAVIEDNAFVVYKGKWKTRIADIPEVPLTFNGSAECMIKNILPAVLAAVISGFSLNTIRCGLQSFNPGPEFTPGRMNIFRFRTFDVMLDYAHNKDGFEMMSKFLKTITSGKKIGIVGCPGDRRGEDISVMGYYAAKMFDEIIIRHDRDGRGKTNDQLTALIVKGIREFNSAIPVKVISGEVEALRHAMETAAENSFIVVFSDDVKRSLEFLKTEKQKEPRSEMA